MQFKDPRLSLTPRLRNSVVVQHCSDASRRPPLTPGSRQQKQVHTLVVPPRLLARACAALRPGQLGVQLCLQVLEEEPLHPFSERGGARKSSRKLHCGPDHRRTRSHPAQRDLVVGRDASQRPMDTESW